MAKKTAIEKLNEKKEIKIVDLSQENKKVQKIMGKGKMLIATPLEIYEIIKKIPKNQIVSSIQIRKQLAQKYNVDTTCPLTTGIFINICSQANLEYINLNQDHKVVPTFRVLKKCGELNEKYPNGVEVQKTLLEAEGHEIIKKGKKYFVKNFEEK